MAIVINNTEKVIEDANGLISNSEKMNEISSSIAYILSELAPLWEGTQSDAISYNTNLRKNQELVKLRENFVEYIKENIELIKQSIILVIIEEDVDTKQEAFKVIEKYATVCEFKPQNPMQLEKRLKAICNRV